MTVKTLLTAEIDDKLNAAVERRCFDLLARMMALQHRIEDPNDHGADRFTYEPGDLEIIDPDKFSADEGRADDWVESEHPRDKAGKFADKRAGTSGGAPARLSAWARQEQSHPSSILAAKLAAKAPKPTQQELKAVRDYTFGGFVRMNKRLRRGQDGGRNAEQLRKYLNRARIPKNVTVYRGVDRKYAKTIKSQVRVGSVLRDRGFMSTTTDPRLATNFSIGDLIGSTDPAVRKFRESVPGRLAARLFFRSGLVFEIKVNKGAKGASMRDIGDIKPEGFLKENEVLFQAGSALKVVSFDGNRVKCELVQGGAGRGRAPSPPARAFELQGGSHEH
jgi:hypothetical protein